MVEWNHETMKPYHKKGAMDVTFVRWCTWEKLEQAIDAYVEISDGIRDMAKSAVFQRQTYLETFGKSIRDGVMVLNALISQYRAEGGEEPLELILPSIRSEARYNGCDVDRIAVSILKEWR